jgi:hypothetical protein
MSVAPPQPPDPRRDVWHFAVNGYDRDAAYCWSTDSKGHYEQVNLKLTPGTKAIIEALISIDGTPFRSAQDFIRNAIVHEARYRVDKDQAGEDVWQRMEDILHMENLGRIRRDIETRATHINTLWDTLRLLTETGQQNKAVEQVDVFEDIVLSTYDDDDIRRNSLAVIVQMRNYLRTGQGLPELQPEVVEFEIEKKKRRA